MRPLGIAVLIGLASGLAGCVLPPAFTIASFAADGFSLALSHKTVTDQAISLLAHRDCRLWRLMQAKPICGADTSVVAVAQLPPSLPLRAASPGFEPPTAVASVPPAAKPQPQPAVALTQAPVPAAPKPEQQPEEKAPAMPPPPAPPAPTSSPIATSTPASQNLRPKLARAPSMPAHQAVSPSIVPSQSPAAPSRPIASSSRVRGEMIIRSGTDQAEARALADSLRAAGAFVRPVRHGDLVIYEVVMSLSS